MEEEAEHGPNLAFLLAWVHLPQVSKGLNSRQTRNNAPVIKFETKTQQGHIFAARQQIAFSFLSHFFFTQTKHPLMKYVQFAIFTFPLFNNRKGFAGLLLIFAFLIKILKGVLGELNQQKGGGKKNLMCIPQDLLMEEACCLFKSIF